MMLLGLLCLATFAVLVSGKVLVQPTRLTDADWSQMLDGEWLVEFYAPWCPACKALATEWEKVAGWGAQLGFKVAEVDITENPNLSGRFLVMALPTIIHVKDGVFRMYSGNRDEKEIVSFVDDKKYEEVDPIPWWKSPSTPQMGAVGLFFKASALVQQLHTQMTRDYGFPVWASYAVFGLTTILVGLMLGVLLVFFCDLILPASPTERISPEHYKKFDPDAESESGKDGPKPAGDRDESLRQRTAAAKDVQL